MGLSKVEPYSLARVFTPFFTTIYPPADHLVFYPLSFVGETRLFHLPSQILFQGPLVFQCFQAEIQNRARCG